LRKLNAKSGDFISAKNAAYVDLSLFQMIEALSKAMAQLEPQHQRLVLLRESRQKFVR